MLTLETLQKIITCHIGNGASIAAIKGGGLSTPQWLDPIGRFDDGFSF